MVYTWIIGVHFWKFIVNNSKKVSENKIKKLHYKL